MGSGEAGQTGEKGLERAGNQELAEWEGLVEPVQKIGGVQVSLRVCGLSFHGLNNVVNSEDELRYDWMPEVSGIVKSSSGGHE